MADLRPCPFCESAPSLGYSDALDSYQYRCSSCEVAVPDSWRDTSVEAADVWNTRPSEDALRAEIGRLADVDKALGELHQLCADVGIPPGYIVDRVRALVSAPKETP